MSNVYAAAPTNAMRADALAGVRTRRILAVCIDLFLVSLLVAALWIISIVLTFGFALFFLPPLYPFVAFFYNGLTVSGAKMATPGMRAMDLEMRMHDTGARVPFVNAAVQAVLFYVSWFFPPILLVSLVDGEKRCLHDIIAGVCDGAEAVMSVGAKCVISWRRRILMESWRRCDQGSARRPAILPHRSLGVPLPVWTAESGKSSPIWSAGNGPLRP